MRNGLLAEISSLSRKVKLPGLDVSINNFKGRVPIETAPQEGSLHVYTIFFYFMSL